MEVDDNLKEIARKFLEMTFMDTTTFISEKETEKPQSQKRKMKESDIFCRQSKTNILAVRIECVFRSEISFDAVRRILRKNNLNARIATTKKSEQKR